MEWADTAIILECIGYGESDVRAIVFAAQEGAWHGLVRGGASRRHSAVWQVGNVVAARWIARLPEQLGSLTGELVHPAAALAMGHRMALTVLRSACAVASGALPEREPHPAAFAGLAGLLGSVTLQETILPRYVEYELGLLRELGYGLDFSSCAVTGLTEGLAYVSPRTGRAVAGAAAGMWAPRLLALPKFLVTTEKADLVQCRDGLLLTGHFLARHVFGTRHAPLPPARVALYELVDRMMEEQDHAG